MAIAISGTCYTDEGVTTMGSGRTVSVSVNGGAAAGSTTTAADGTWTISAITAAAGAVLTLYLQGNTEVGVTITSSTGVDMTGVNIYQDGLSIRSDGGALTGANINTSDTNGDSGITAIYSAPNNSTVTLAAGKSLYVHASQTWSGSTIATVPGNLSNRGTISNANITFTGTGAQTIRSNGSTLAGVAVNGSGGTYTLLDALTLSGNLTLTAGTLDVSASNFAITVGGNWNWTAGSFTARSGTVTFNSAGSKTVNGGGGSFYNLTHSGAGTLTLTTSALSVSNTLNNSAGTLDASASNLGITVGGTWSNAGTFTARSGTVTLNGTGQTISGSTTFYNLQKTVSSADTLTFTDGTTQTISNAITLQGAAGQLLTLAGTSTGGWTIAMPVTQTLSYLSVSYSTATGNTAAAGSTSTDGGHNTNWTFASSTTSAGSATRAIGRQHRSGDPIRNRRVGGRL